MSLPLSQEQSSASPEDLIKAIQEKTKEYVEQRSKEVKVEIDIVEKAAKSEETGGFWDEFIADPLAELGAEYEAAFGDLKSVSEAKANFESLVHSVMDPAATLANSVSGILDPSLIDVNRIISDPTQAASVIERVPNLGGGKSALSGQMCQQSLIQSVATTAASVLTTAISNVARAVKTVHSSVSFLQSSTEDLGPALMNIAVQNFSSLLINQDVLLDQIAGVISDIVGTLDGMDEDDYLTDHVTLIRTQQLQVQSAEQDLIATRAQLLHGGDLNKTRWVAARSKLREASDELCGLKLGISGKPLVLYGYATYLDYLIDVLERQVSLTGGISDNIRNFRSNFIASTTFDSLFTPIVDQIACRVRKVIEDMDATLAKNQFIRYLVKEKQWCLELMAIAAVMKFADKMNIDSALSKFSGTDALEDAADAVGDALGDAASKTDDSAVINLIPSLRLYSSRIKRKASTNISSSALIEQGEILLANIEAAKNNNSSLLGITGEFTTKVVLFGGAAITAVSTLMDFAADRNVSSFVDALSNGDIVKALQLDALTGSVEGQLANLTAQLTPAVEAADISLNDLEIVSQEYQEQLRSVNLADSLQHGFADAHLKDLKENELTRLKAVDEAVQRLAEDLGAGADTSAKTVTIPSFSRPA